MYTIEISMHALQARLVSSRLEEDDDENEKKNEFTYTNPKLTEAKPHALSIFLFLSFSVILYYKCILCVAILGDMEN